MQYVTILLAAAVVIMAMVLVGFVHILVNATVQYEAEQSITRQIYSNLKQVQEYKDQVKVSEEFEYEKDGVYSLIINKEGKIIKGEYPSDIPEIEGEKLDGRVQEGGMAYNQYYIKDRYIDKQTKQFFIRSIIKKSDVYSRYQKMQNWTYIVILFIFFIVLLGGLILGYKISGSLKVICRTAEEVGNNLDMSKRIDYQGRFREIAILAEADNRMLERMENTFHSQEQFTADVAHELRTPVAVMMAQCQYLEEQANELQDYEEAMEVITRQTRRMNTLIGQLLNLSRMDQGRIQIEKEKVDLFEIVQSICEEEQEKAGDKVLIEQNLKEVYASVDINLIMIALNNLISNAVKFSPNGGKIQVELCEKNQKVCISVTDHGCGISEKNQQQIFRRFYREKKKEKVDGFGLGLSIASKIAEIHGGIIEMQSVEGAGSTFVLMLDLE